MSLKTSILVGLVGGAVAYGGLMWKWTHADFFKEVNLEERERRFWQSNQGTPLPLDKQEQEIRELLAGWIHLRGPEDRQSLEHRALLAQLLLGEKKYSEAEAECRATVDAMNRAFGPKDERTIEARRTLAYLLREMGKLPEEEAELRLLLAQAEGGSVHGARRRLIESFQRQEKFKEERELLEVELKEIEPRAAAQKSPGYQWAKENDYRRDEIVWLERISLAEQKEQTKAQLEKAKLEWGENDSRTQDLAKKLQELKNAKLHDPRKVKPSA